MIFQKQEIQLNANIMVHNIAYVILINIINKNINVKKHEAQPMQACLQSVACRWAKC